MPRAGLDLPVLLQAAAEIADTEGWEAVTLASLAKKLNVRSPSLYNHIDGLPGLRRKLALHGMRKLKERLAASTEGRTGVEAIRAFCQAYVAYAREHPGLYDATLRASDRDDEPERTQAGAEIVGLALDALRSRGLEGDAALHAVRGLRSLLHGFVSLEQKGGFGLPLELDETFRRIVDAYIVGLSAFLDQG